MILMRDSIQSINSLPSTRLNHFISTHHITIMINGKGLGTSIRSVKILEYYLSWLHCSTPNHNFVHEKNGNCIVTRKKKWQVESIQRYFKASSQYYTSEGWCSVLRWTDYQPVFSIPQEDGWGTSCGIEKLGWQALHLSSVQDTTPPYTFIMLW